MKINPFTKPNFFSIFRLIQQGLSRLYHYQRSMRQTWDSAIREQLLHVDELMEKSIASNQAELTEICRHILDSGGKRMRPGICILSFLASGGADAEKVIKMAAAFELIHSATLIHDDINDDSELRRGAMTAHRKFTVPKAIIAGDYLFVQGFRLGGAMDETIVNSIADACNAMAEGEFIQSDHERKTGTPIEVYRKIIEGKTAKPIAAGARVGSYLADGDSYTIEAMGGYGLNIGLAFQIADDILDIEGEMESTGKQPGIDIHEGKPTLPIIMAMEDDIIGPRISEIFALKDKTDDEVQEALKLIRSSDVLERCKKYARDYAHEAKDYLEGIQDSIYRDSLIILADYVVERNL